MFRLLSILLFTLPAGAAAQVPDTTIALPEVEVEADRTAQASATTAGRVTTLDGAVLDGVQARTVADVLAARTGLFVKRYGSGGLATLAQRGLGSAHTLLLLDGLRVADPQTGQMDLSLLPTVLLDRVEVAYGAASTLHGADGLGGAVHLHTLEAGGPGRLRISAGAGAYGERRLGGVLAGGRGRLGAVVAAEVSRADGAFPYRNEVLFPPQNTRRAGADRALSTLFGRAVYRPEGQQLAVGAWLNRTERGLPGPANASPADARQWDRYLRLWARYERRLPHGTFALKTMTQRTVLRYANPAAGTDETARPRSFEVDVRLRLAVTPRWLVGGGLTVGHDAAALRGGVRQARYGAVVHATGELGRLLVYPTLRLDHVRVEGRATWAVSPRLGLNAQPMAWPGLRLKASLGRAFRTPTFNERFWQPGGNPSLRPERGWSADAGLHVQAGGAARRGAMEISFFAAWLRDQIVWTPGFVDPSVLVWQPANLQRVVTRGVELSLDGQQRLGGALIVEGGLAYTFTDARDRSARATASFGQPLRYVPRQQLKLFAGLVWGALRLDASGRLVGPRPLTSDGTMHVAAYRVFDVEAAYRRAIGRVGMALAVAVENVFDHTYTIVRFYPMPPRHARVRLTLDLHSSP